MKKIGILSIFAILLAFGLVHQPALAAAPPQVMSVISVNLPVYDSFERLSDSSKQYNPDELPTGHLADLGYNEQVTILNEKDYAAQIQFQVEGVTKTGWVHSAYLSNNIMNQTWFVKQWRNLHTEPNSKSPLVNENGVGSNSMVHVLAYNKATNYYQVQLPDGKTTGWIKGSYLDDNGFDHQAGRNIIPYEFNKVGTVTTNFTIFTPLNTKANVKDAQIINQFIDFKANGKKSLMTGKGSIYLQAQDKSGLNAIYLMAHSGLETGWGVSGIANNKYNFYGIGATDLQPMEGAFTYSSPEDGIRAGAIFISRTYVYRDKSITLDLPIAQPTLDNMRFNDGFHEYATDQAWAGKISNIMKEFNIFNTKGWKTVAGKSFYNNGDGTYKTGWLVDGGKRYYFNSSGVMQTGWVKDGGSWYYLNASGVMQTGWLKYNSEWYYLNTQGKMLTGWQKISGKWYYFYSSGKMAHDTKIGGYRLGHSGAMI